MALNLTKHYTPGAGQIALSASYNIDIAALFNAFSGIEAQTSSLGGLTITPLSDGNSIFVVNNSAGARILTVDTTTSKIIDTSTGGIVSTYGLLHDRGDPDSVDKTTTDFLPDGNWNYIDLSAIVPTDAKAILFNFVCKANTVEAKAQFRKNGNSNVYNVSLIYSQVVNTYMSTDFIVPWNANGLMDYNFANGAWTVLNIVVKGWWR